MCLLGLEAHILGPSSQAGPDTTVRGWDRVVVAAG